MSKILKPYVNYFVRLQIFGNIPDLNVISKKLGVLPTRTHFKKDRPTRVSKPYGYDAWIFRAPVSDHEAFEKHLRSLHGVFQRKTRQLKELAAKYDVSFYCSYHSNYDRGDLEFPPEIVAWCAKIGIPIRVSILVQD